VERLNERLQAAEKALRTLREILKEPTSEVIRDAAILRFTYTFETVWKAAQLYLAEREELEAGSPVGVIRACWQAGILDEQQTEAASRMARDRNLTVHTYQEELAIELYGRLRAHADLLSVWLERLRR
jgi:nucleotidyltransferase substrate binding protein (TIGR01987 family)